MKEPLRSWLSIRKTYSSNYEKLSRLSMGANILITIMTHDMSASMEMIGTNTTTGTMIMTTVTSMTTLPGS